MWKKFHRKHASNISNQHLTGLTEVQIYYKLSTVLATQLVKGLTTNAPRRGVWGACPKKILKIKCSRSDSEGTWADLRHIRHIFKGHFCKDHTPPLGAPPPPGTLGTPPWIRPWIWKSRQAFRAYGRGNRSMPFRTDSLPKSHNNVAGENTVLQINILETGVLTLLVKNSFPTRLRRLTEVV